MIDNFFATREEAEEYTNEAVCQVTGGFLACSWEEFYRRIDEEAASLQDGGWTSNDKAELMSEYGFDEIHADYIVKEIRRYEEYSESGE